MDEPKSIYPLLCQAWGESDLPCAFIAYTEAEVRKFIVNEWWGDDTDERVDEVLASVRDHDWRDEPEWNAEFEIGGVSFKPVYESNSRAAVAAQPEAGEAVALSMDTAPKDATMIRLLVEFEDGSFEDSLDPCWTIGTNHMANTGVDEWLFAGWNWTHDCFTQGTGTPVGWLPMLASAPTIQPTQPVQEREVFARRWEMLAYMHTRGVTFHVYDHYIGNPDRLDFAATLHREYLAGELARAALSATPPAQPEAVGEPVLNVTLTRDEAEYIAAFVSAEDNEPSDEVVTLMVGNGHSGYGLYCVQAEYPEEGAVFIRALAAAPTTPAQAGDAGEPSDGEWELYVRLIQMGYSEGWSDHKRDRQHGMKPEQLNAAIDAAIRATKGGKL